jgi:hypothetical protein
VKPLFQRIVAIGHTSPKPLTESLMLSKRENGKVPSGVANAPVTVPVNEVLSRP